MPSSPSAERTPLPLSCHSSLRKQSGRDAHQASHGGCALCPPCPVSPLPSTCSGQCFYFLSLLYAPPPCSQETGEVQRAPGLWGHSGSGQTGPALPSAARGSEPMCFQSCREEGCLDGGELLTPRGRIYRARPREQPAQSPGTFPRCEVSKHRAVWHLVPDKVR